MRPEFIKDWVRFGEGRAGKREVTKDDDFNDGAIGFTVMALTVPQ